MRLTLGMWHARNNWKYWSLTIAKKERRLYKLTLGVSRLYQSHPEIAICRMLRYTKTRWIIENSRHIFWLKPVLHVSCM
jgi:hypothetical protein